VIDLAAHAIGLVIDEQFTPVHEAAHQHGRVYREVPVSTEVVAPDADLAARDLLVWRHVALELLMRADARHPRLAPKEVAADPDVGVLVRVVLLVPLDLGRVSSERKGLL
jgi:hypothetical protein